MRELHCGVELGVQSWPALLTMHEGRCRRAAEWESEDAVKKMGAVHDTGMELDDNNMWLQHPQIVAFRDNDVWVQYQQIVSSAEVVVAKLQQSPKSAIVCTAAVNALAWITQKALHKGAVVAAGAVPACVRILQEGPDNAKQKAGVALCIIAGSAEHRGAVVVAGAVPACVRILQEGPDDAKRYAAGALFNI